MKKIPELRPIIKQIEHKIDIAICSALYVPMPTVEIEAKIKTYDLLAQKIEAYNFMVSRGLNWEGMPDVSIEKLQEFEMPIDSLGVFYQFMSLYVEIKSKIKEVIV